MSKQKTALSPTREENFAEWYQQVIKAADLAETSPVRGCMVVKPWGYGIWERTQAELDKRIKETGHENAYFPLFIPLSFLEKEAAHVEGFAKECAVVTHHRLEEKDGALVPAGKLEEPLVVRPTSETIIGDAFSRWVKSYRDLPLLINQWANVVRWEMRPRLFLRTAEFLWQEGHTCHAEQAEAEAEVAKIAELYRTVIEDYLAIPVIVGEKPEGDRFPGAENTVSLEAMMQDGKALQAGTSHFLGQKFAKAQGIQFLSSEGELEYVHTTSWGVSTRLIGGLIMTHSDDDGLRVPPKVAQKQVVILPVIPKEEHEEAVLDACEKLSSELSELSYSGLPLGVLVDKRDIRGGEKNWQWIKKGIPLRIEIGPRDIESGKCVLYRRDAEAREKAFLEQSELANVIPGILDEIQQRYFDEALAYREEQTSLDIGNASEFEAFFKDGGGFVRGAWCGDEKGCGAQRPSEQLLADLKVSIRCIPYERKSSGDTCILCGKSAEQEAVFARAY